MRLRAASLGLKLNLYLLLFFVVLGTATSAILLYGFNRTQDNANARSEEALEELGRVALSAVAGGAAEQAGLQFETASEIGQQAARYMESFRQIGATAPFVSSDFARSDAGLFYDPDPDRTSDVLIWSYVSVDDEAVQDELAYTAALDAIFETLFRRFADEVGGRNFDPNAIAFLGVNGVNRYYPPRGLHELITRDLDPSPLFEQVGPANNPDRQTMWSAPYEDSAGEGLVVTAESPVYEGDTLRGAIQVDLLIQRLIDQINAIKPTPSGFAFYVGIDGNPLQTEAYGLLAGETANPDLAAVLDGMKASDAGGGVVVEEAILDGEEFFIAHAPMPSLGGSLAVAAPVSELTAEAAAITAGIDDQGERTLWAMLAAMGALFLAGLAAAGYLNRRVLISPIAELLAGTRSVGAGDLETAIAVHSSDELGALAAGFNSMVDDLRARSAALEREVQEREEAQSELGALFAAMDDVVLVFDRDGRCLRVAPTSPDLLYAPAADVQGRTLQEFMPPAQADIFLERIRATLTEGTRQTIEYPMDLSSGQRWFSAAITPMGVDRVVYVARDITEGVRAEQLLEQRVEERTRELHLLLDVSQNVASTLDLRELASRISDQLREVIPYDGAGVLVVEGSEILVLEARDSSGARDEPIAGQRFELPLQGPAGDAIERRTAIIVEDVEAVADLTNARQAVPGAAASARSWLAAPMIAQDRVVGVLSFWSSSPDVYGARHADLAMAVANQAAVAIENARLYQQASAVAALEERQRLARELHDSVSQALYGIALGAQTARQLLDTNAAQAIQPVDYVLSLAEAGLAEMRALIFELRPESLATEGLVSAVEKQAAATRARYGLTVVTTLPPEPEAPLSVKETLYRIVQEAMHNTIKHARAQRIELVLTTVGSDLRVEVSDDGIGFDPNGEFPGHLGLRSMRERVAALGGSLEISSDLGAGTRVSATVPLSRP
jgi:PAS domain S-box-containing protein